MNQETIEFRRIFSEARKQARVKECIWNEINSEETCDGDIVKAHSIQRSKILRNISDSGHILRFSGEGMFDESIEPFSEEGIGKFSTFSGFCKKHDKDIFHPIEDFEFTGQINQFYIYAFRSCSKEYHTLKETMNRFEKQWKAFQSDDDLSDPLVQIQKAYIEHKIQADSISYVELKHACTFLQKRIMAQDFSGVSTYYTILEEMYPIATNSCFIPYHNFNGQMIFSPSEIEWMITNYQDSVTNIPFIFFNLFPESGKTHVIFSHFAGCASRYSFYEKLFNEISEIDSLYILSNIIINYCENTAFSPEYIKDKFTKSERKAILEAFCENVIDTSIFRDARINLFRK